MFYREELLAPRPTPKMEDHTLSAVHECLFNLFAATPHKGGRSSIRNLRTRHAVVTRTHYTVQFLINYFLKIHFNYIRPFTHRPSMFCLPLLVGNYNVSIHQNPYYNN